MEKRPGLRRVIRKERPVTEFVNPAATDGNINLLKKSLISKKQPKPQGSGGREFQMSNRINILTINKQSQMNEKSRQTVSIGETQKSIDSFKSSLS